MTMTNVETYAVRVLALVTVELDRVHWDYITGEDYYVRVNGHTIGIVGYNEYRKRWGGAEVGGYPHKTRISAINALLRKKVTGARFD